jgi:uncharacterized phage protein gp47/JayE
MNYIRPSFTELQARINADLALIPAVLAEPLSAMWARACHSQHGYLDWILAQCSPLTCELERLYDWAALYATPRLLSVAAQGSVIATGNAGAVILADTLLRATNGLNYQVINAVTLTSTATPVFVRCTTRGAITNVAAGQVLTLIDPVLGCNNALSVGSLGLTGGADDESLNDWRLRVADEWQTMVVYGGRSGKPMDYIAWAKSAHPSVTSALVQPHLVGVGTVVIRPICNDLPNRQPTTEVLTAIAAYFQPIAPATADWRLTAPLLQAITVSVHLSPEVDTTANRLAINDFLSALILSKVTNQAELWLTEIDTAILSVTSHYTRNAPLANITADAGAVFVLNPLVFT